MFGFQPFLFFIILFSFQDNVVASATKAQNPPSIQAFHSLVEKSQERSPDLKQTRGQESFQEAKAWSTQTLWWPRLDLQLSQTRYRDNSLLQQQTFPFPLPKNDDQTKAEWGLNLSFPLYNRAIHLEFQESREQLELTRQQRENSETLFSSNLHHLLANYLLQVYRESCLENSILNASNNLKESRLSFNLGKKTKIDVLRSEANLVALESKKISLQQQRESSLAKVLLMSGLTREEFTEVLNLNHLPEKATEKEKGQSLDDLVQLDSLLKDLEKGRQSLTSDLNQSPRYQTLEKEVRVLNTQSSKLMQKEFPQLSLQGQIGRQGNTWNKAIDTEDTNRSISLVLKIPLFAGGSTLSSWREERESLKLNQLKKEKEIFELKTSLENEYLKIEAMKKSMDSLIINLQTREEIYRLSKLNYGLGNASIVDLLSAQDELLNTKIQLAEIKVDLSQLLHQYLWELGMKSEEI